MKTPKEVKKRIAKIRRVLGKKNGVISWLWDRPKLVMLVVNSKKLKKKEDIE